MNSPNAEAIRYRRRLRSTEAELDTALTALLVTEKHLLELLAAEVLEVPGAVHAAGVDWDSARDPVTRSLDPALCRAEIARAADRAGLARRGAPSAVTEWLRELSGADRDALTSLVRASAARAQSDPGCNLDLEDTPGSTPAAPGS